MCKNCQDQQDQACDCGGNRAESSCECDGECSFQSGSHFQRHYQNKEEQIAELEDYLKDLKAEAQAVEERLTDLRK